MVPHVSALLHSALVKDSVSCFEALVISAPQFAIVPVTVKTLDSYISMAASAEYKLSFFAFASIVSQAEKAASVGLNV